MWYKTAQISKKNAFTIENEIEADSLSRRKSTGILTVLRSISGPNLVIVAWTGDKLLYGQAQNGKNLDLQVIFDIENQGQSTPKTIGFLTILRCISGPNLMILTETSEKLSCGQAQNEVKFDFKLNLTLKVKVDHPQNNRHLNQGVLRLMSYRKQVIDTHTHRHTDTRTDTQSQAMTIPKGQNWPRVKMEGIGYFLDTYLTSSASSAVVFSKPSRNSKWWW